MRLHGNDIDETTTVLEADLGWIVGWHKGEFVGSDVLRLQKADGVARKLVGFEMLERGIARQGHDAYVGDAKVGYVTSGTQTPTLKKAIGMAYLPVAHAVPGAEFDRRYPRAANAGRCCSDAVLQAATGIVGRAWFGTADIGSQGPAVRSAEGT